jgi:hypothetical protein
MSLVPEESQEMVLVPTQDLDTYSEASDSTDELQRGYLCRAFLSSTKLPESYSQAIKSPEAPHWQKAMEEEYQSLEQNQTWNLVPLPANKNLIKGRWVYAYKYNDQGDIIKHKARWVAKGFEQQYGQDYEQTFAAVIKPMSYKLLFAVAAVNNWEIEQMDVKTAFLHGKLEEEVFLEQPHGYQKGTTVCKLNKALYGLKQSPRVWYNTLKEFLCQIGFKVSTSDQAMFFQTDIIITAYVDDLLLFGKHMSLINTVKSQLKKRFEMKDIGPACYFLGMQIVRDRKLHTIKLSQSSYLTKALEHFAMQDCKPVQVPLAPGKILEKSTSTSPPDATRKYQSIIGTLMYAMTGTRPDLAFAVSKLSQFASNPNTEHWTSLKRILRYVQGTLQVGLLYQGDQLDCRGYTDSDWAGDQTSRKSTGGYVFTMAGAPISWCSKRQNTIALSSCEAEYMAMTQAAKEAIWLLRLVHEIGLPQTQITLYCDNQGAIALAHNPEHHVRTKHIDIAHHYIRDVVKNNIIKLVYIATEEQVADGLTKALCKEKFQRFKTLMGLC